MAFLELKNVDKGFGRNGSRTEVLSDINLEIEKGEFVAIVGYSGAGKTTLISLIAGLTRADSGSLTLDGSAITEPSPDRGVVFQNYSLLPWLSVFENILLGVEQVFPDSTPTQHREQVEKYIEMVNLTPARDKKPGELSGGMRQRVSVARALAIEPRILLLDEPLSALDALTRATLQDEISRIWQEHQRTVVLITNDVDEGILLADRILPLSAGPGATLGPAVHVDLPRPRDRKAVNHDPNFKRIRCQVIEYLLGDGAKKHATVSRKLVLPEIEPEDLSVPRRFSQRSRGPIRRGEIKRVEVKT
ncbi:MAG TPA: ABC transporter ATP-binding protein [Verrucomicrobiae bacterium]|nr:ABC transporter ATP-binding protein [Verrucomicrobiae bacterium]